jgi:type IV pilus assembly protein PilN
MIRINLLGIPRPKKGKRGGGAAAMASMAGTPGEGPSAVIFLLLGLVLGGGVFGYLFYKADAEGKDLQAKLVKANEDGLRLVTVKQKYDQRKKEADAFEKRVKVIDQLRAEQSGPVNLLNTVGNTVNNTDAVWLTQMQEAGNNINIEGMALSTQAVANLMTNLKRSGYFKNVEIKETAQDPSQKEMTAFTFTLVCEKQPRS